MPATLLHDTYGKSAVRMTKVRRDAPTGRHDLIEIEASIALEGRFETAHTRGDNSAVLPTDTMKNTVYALGKNHPLDTIESFAVHLGKHFVGTQPQVSRARVVISQSHWTRATVQGREHPHCFIAGDGRGERAVCDVSVRREATGITGGVEGLVLLKTTDSGFSGFPRDKFTTLRETDDRIFATIVSARWAFAHAEADFGAARGAIRTALIETFAGHKSLSVQQTLYAMGEAALAACHDIAQVHLTLPNQHRILADLSPFGLTNHNEIFVTTSEPFGLIEATIGRT